MTYKLTDSRVVERLKNFIGKFLKTISTMRRKILMPSLSSRNNDLSLAIKNYTKEDAKVFWFCAILLYSFTFFQIF